MYEGESETRSVTVTIRSVAVPRIPGAMTTPMIAAITATNAVARSSKFALDVGDSSGGADGGADGGGGAGSSASGCGISAKLISERAAYSKSPEKGRHPIDLLHPPAGA